MFGQILIPVILGIASAGALGIGSRFGRNVGRLGVGDVRPRRFLFNGGYGGYGRSPYSRLGGVGGVGGIGGLRGMGSMRGLGSPLGPMGPISPLRSPLSLPSALPAEEAVTPGTTTQGTTLRPIAANIRGRDELTKGIRSMGEKLGDLGDFGFTNPLFNNFWERFSEMELLSESANKHLRSALDASSLLHPAARHKVQTAANAALRADQRVSRTNAFVEEEMKEQKALLARLENENAELRETNAELQLALEKQRQITAKLREEIAAMEDAIASLKRALREKGTEQARAELMASLKVMLKVKLELTKSGEISVSIEAQLIAKIEGTAGVRSAPMNSELMGDINRDRELYGVAA